MYQYTNFLRYFKLFYLLSIFSDMFSITISEKVHLQITTVFPQLTTKYDFFSLPRPALTLIYSNEGSKLANPTSEISIIKCLLAVNRPIPLFIILVAHLMDLSVHICLVYTDYNNSPSLKMIVM